MNPLQPDWKWGTAEGSRELDRRLDRRMTFREILEWLEESESLALRLQASLSRTREQPAKNDPE